MTKEKSIAYIKTNCKTIHCLLDDFQKPEVRKQIPKKGLVVVISETGNRDWAVIRYLSKWGYTNIVGLQFGMREWIKSGYPVIYKKRSNYSAKKMHLMLFFT